MSVPPWILVIAKEPRPGRVKTRLCPPYTPDEAADLAEAALVDTLHAVVEVCSRGAASALLLLDGRPGRWLPAGIRCVPQSGGSLDERLGAAFDRVAGEPAFLVGMDTPQLTPELVEDALEATMSGAALGPASDGGWWGLGLAKARGSLLRGVETSTSRTGALQRARLIEAGLRVTELPALTDVDTAADAELVAQQCPQGRFAAVHAEVANAVHRRREFAS